MKKAHKIGAIAFLLWGIVHIMGGGMILAQPDTKTALAMFGPLVADTQIPENPMQIVDGIVKFHAFNIMWMGIVTSLIALFLNWKNSRAGFWINVLIVGFADLGLIQFVLSKGTMGWGDGFLGPLLFVIAVPFSLVGLKRNQSVA